MVKRVAERMVQISVYPATLWIPVLPNSLILHSEKYASPLHPSLPSQKSY
jgi:hypothetical protein